MRSVPHRASRWILAPLPALLLLLAPGVRGEGGWLRSEPEPASAEEAGEKVGKTGTAGQRATRRARRSSGKIRELARFEEVPRRSALTPHRLRGWPLDLEELRLRVQAWLEARKPGSARVAATACVHPGTDALRAVLGARRLRDHLTTLRTLVSREHPVAALQVATHVLRVHHDRAIRDPEVWIEVGKAFSLLGEAQLEISALRGAVTADPRSAEGHFMLAMAYDKVDDSPKVLEHAQNALRLDPDHKARVKSRLRDSNISRRIGRIVTRVLEDSRRERLSDERVESYAEQLGEVLGEERPTASAR